MTEEFSRSLIVRMVKAVLLIIVIVAAVGGGLYYYTNQNSQVSNTPVPQKIVNRVNVTPTPTPTPLVTTDESIGADMTALEKDLAGLEKSAPALNQEVNGL